MGLDAPKPKPAKRKLNTPELDRYPLGGDESEPPTTDAPSANIDWSHALTKSAAAHIADALESPSAGDSRLQLLKLPPGRGKTAIVVMALGLLQERLGRHLPFVILVSRAIRDRRGWDKTIVSWNESHPDNMLNPFLIETYIRFSNILKDQKSRAQLAKETGKDLVLAIDEIHNYKNPTSVRSKQLQKLSYARKIGATATPLTNNIPIDICSYLVMAGYYKNKSRFMSETGLADRLGRGSELLAYDESGRISDVIWPGYSDVRKQMSRVLYAPRYSDDNLVMPGVNSEVVQLERNEDLVSDVESLGQAYRKRMFDSAAEFVNAVRERINSDKQRVEELIKIASSDDVVQPLVFYWHVSTRDALADALDEAGIGYQEVSGSSGISNIDDTVTDKPILIQYIAGSEGVEFKNSNTSVFYENQGSFTRLEQARGRNVRRNMTGTVDHYYFVAQEHFDYQVFERVSKAGELSAAEVEDIALEAASVERLD